MASTLVEGRLSARTDATIANASTEPPSVMRATEPSMIPGTRNSAASDHSAVGPPRCSRDIISTRSTSRISQYIMVVT
jgi:hypothetical protein